ncbi:melanization protease 1-like isoform X2 [Thrips palmi]|uniref:CLIP domain-containing serine protease n=1 Tax=Thrips palmi TaxID=161013 RepID=A0A6P8YQK7_THRPL|nr:melanization protease 1-like isoform X2 [Thrips palmi]
MTSRPCLLMIILLVCTSYTGGALTGKECQTPDNKMGACIPLLKCPSLLHRFNEEPLTPASKTFLRASNCGAAEQSVPDVCCEKLDLPTMGCGDGVIPKIMGGEEAKLGEHPWMALFNIYYYNANVTMFGCGGSLINKRYVLSAAHCASTPKENRINFVRLGEHNIETSPDCQYDHAAKSTFCADKAIDYTVEMEIVHEDYNPRNVTNDVLLIRLSTDVVYTDFIKPLCLPEIEEVLPFPEVGALLTVVGWGRSREGSKMSQDLFADEEDNVDLFDTTEDAVEFSGISGSGTSSSPGSQQLLQTPAPTPAPAPEPTSSSKRQGHIARHRPLNQRPVQHEHRQSKQFHHLVRHRRKSFIIVPSVSQN